jgi:hypothetical protein
VRQDRNDRPRNTRPRDDLGRPQPYGSAGEPPTDAPALPPVAALAEATRLLHTGKPFAAHEVLEAVWKAADGPDRELWRGLAQLAVGVTHAMRGNPSGATSLLERAAASMAPYEGTRPHDIDVTGLRAWCLAAAADPAMAERPPRLR